MALNETKPNAGIVFAYTEQEETHVKTGDKRTMFRPLIEVHIGDNQVIYFSTMDVGGKNHDEVQGIVEAIEQVFILSFEHGKLTKHNPGPQGEPDTGSDRQLH